MPGRLLTKGSKSMPYLSNATRASIMNDVIFVQRPIRKLQHYISAILTSALVINSGYLLSLKTTKNENAIL